MDRVAVFVDEFQKACERRFGALAAELASRARDPEPRMERGSSGADRESESLTADREAESADAENGSARAACGERIADRGMRIADRGEYYGPGAFLRIRRLTLRFRPRRT